MLASSPSVFREPVALCSERHRDHGLLTLADYRFAADVMTVPVGIGELPTAALQYPIVFLNGNRMAAVVDPLGGGNPFVDAAGKWRPGYYIPNFLQVYPFRIDKIHDQDAGLLVFDAASGRVVDVARNGRAARFFDSEGNPTTTLQKLATACGNIYREQALAHAFAQSLLETGILSKGYATLRLSAGQVQTLEGFHAINERAYRSQPAETVYRWFQAGWLDAIGLVLLSQRNWRLFEQSGHQLRTGSARG